MDIEDVITVLADIPYVRCINADYAQHCTHWARYQSYHSFLCCCCVKPSGIAEPDDTLQHLDYHDCHGRIIRKAKDYAS